MTDDAWSWLGAGGGEAAAAIRAVNWGATAVGPVESWPPELKSIVSMMLYARHPMFLWWGPELVQFYNDGYTPSFGVGRHPAAMGQKGKECWAEIWPVIGPEIDGVIANREGTFHEDALVPIFRNGRMEDVYWTYGYSPVFDARGGVAGVLVVVTETTTRVVAMRELRAASRSKDEFVAMLGHELRNPLAPITTALGLMEMRDVKGIDREREVITRQVRHLTRLVDDLLDVARLASDKIKLSLKLVDVARVVAQALELAEPLIEQRAQRVQVAVAPGFLVRADESRLTQVFSNLLTNASKYSNPQTEIVVRAESHGERVTVSVHDQGTGIDPEMLPRVFDMFSQERQSLARSAGGLGLGLAIVRNLVDMHGGAVSAHSAGRNQGSTFTVVLPLSQDQFAPQAEPVLNAAAPRSRDVRRVLIVDDNHDAAELLAEVLTDLGHVTCVAADGPTALSLVDAFVPDLALLDIGLPVMDGYELAQHLRARSDGAQLQMYALTGYGQEEDRKRALAAGFDGHFVKPVNLRALARAVEERPQH